MITAEIMARDDNRILITEMIRVRGNRMLIRASDKGN